MSTGDRPYYWWHSASDSTAGVAISRTWETVAYPENDVEWVIPTVTWESYFPDKKKKKRGPWVQEIKGVNI